MSLDPEAKRVVEGLRMPDRSVEQVLPGTRSGRASVERAGHHFLYFGVMVCIHTNSGRMARIRVFSDPARIRVPSARGPSGGGGSVGLLAHLRCRPRANPRRARCRLERADIS